MGSSLVLYGSQLNNVTTVVDISGASFDSSEGADKLHVRNPADIASIRCAATTGCSIEFDLSKTKNGDFEAWASSTIPNYWSKGSLTGQVSKGSAPQIIGTSGYSARLLGQKPYIYQDIKVQVGKSYRFTGDVRSNNVSGGDTAAIKIQNLATRSWLSSSFVWRRQTTGLACKSNASTSFSAVSGTIIIEDYDEVGNDSCWLRVICQNNAASTAHYGIFDTLELYPLVNFVSVHNFPRAGNSPVKIYSSPSIYDGKSWTQRSTGIAFSNTARSGYAYLTSDITARHWRLNFSGIQYGEIFYLGEAVFGHARVSTAKRTYAPSSVNITAGDLIQNSPVGVQSRYRRAFYQRKIRSLDYAYLTSSAFYTIKEIVERGRDYPMVFVLDEDKSEVIYGYISDAYTYKEMPTDKHFSLTLNIEEMPYNIQ